MQIKEVLSALSWNVLTGLTRGLEETWASGIILGEEKLEKWLSADLRSHHDSVAALLAALMRSWIHWQCVETVLIGGNFNTCLTKFKAAGMGFYLQHTGVNQK